jgi:tRNA A37 threonylcarbamoyladenosine synthetase subunit TsaC/SUA5/YrdC
MEARLQLGASVSVYLDGGPGGAPVPSSIVDFTGEAPRLLRAGALDADRLRVVVPDLVTIQNGHK